MILQEEEFKWDKSGEEAFYSLVIAMTETGSHKHQDIYNSLVRDVWSTGGMTAEKLTKKYSYLRTRKQRMRSAANASGSSPVFASPPKQPPTTGGTQ